MTDIICICGDGWGATAAVEGMSGGSTQVIVVTKDDDVIRRARQHSFEVASDLDSVDANLYICSGLTKILSKTFLDERNVINIHYSLLPKYRGLHSTVWAILNDEPYFGLTIHQMNEFIDDGPILYQYKFENIGQNSRQVMVTCNEHIADHLSEVINDIKAGRLRPIKQSKADATWVCRRNLEDCFIDFNQKVEHLELFFRALVEPYPLPRIRVSGRIIEIVECDLVSVNYYMHNGRVVNIEGERAWVKVEGGLMIISSVRDALTGKSVSVSDVFSLGQRIQ